MTLEEILKRDRELCEKAIPGPWFADHGNWEIESHSIELFLYRHSVCSTLPEHRKNFDGKDVGWSIDFGTPEFIAQSRELLPRYIKALEKAIEQRDKLIMDNDGYNGQAGIIMGKRNQELAAILKGK